MSQCVDAALVMPINQFGFVLSAVCINYETTAYLLDIQYIDNNDDEKRTSFKTRSRDI